MAPKTNHEKQIARQVRKFVGVFTRKYPKAPLKTVFSPDLAHFSMKIRDFYNYFRNFKVKILIYEILGGRGKTWLGGGGRAFAPSLKQRG